MMRRSTTPSLINSYFVREGERGRKMGLFEVFPYRPSLLSLKAFLCLSFVCLTALTTADDTLTAYEVLEEYDFPVGLLPKGVVSYDLNKSTGKFSVYLNSTCTFTIDSYYLKYKSTIEGYIAKDKLSKLEGISVKILLFWVNIVTVTQSDDELKFSVGIASADFPVSNFNESAECGCGFDCVNEQVTRIRINPYVSSS